MTTESFEYAVRKDVRNNPIVREVDRERHRDMFRSLGIGVLLVVVLLFWAWQQFELLRSRLPRSSRCSRSARSRKR